MDGVLYSWLGTAAIAPFVTLLSTWTVVVFYSYRSRWRLVDIFLCSFAAHEIVFSLFGFGFAVLSIIRPLLDTPCNFIVWGLAGSRIFHLSALTSLLLDRALSTKFPYTYRYGVRKSQVQYHLAVLGIIAVFVGVTAVFARAPPAVQGVCSVHPLAWNYKFSVFLSSVHGMLLFTGFVCCLAVVVFGKGAEENRPTPVNYESGRSSSSSSSSKTGKVQRDDEWGTVATVCWFCCLVNHGPFLAMTVMGIVMPTFWSPWFDNIIVWISLAQGLLVPILLLVVDSRHRNAVRSMLSQPGRIYRHLSDTSGFMMQVADVPCPKPGVSPTLIMCPPSYTPKCNMIPVPQRIRWTSNNMPSLQSLNQHHAPFPGIFGSPEDSLSKGSSRCLSPEPPSNRDIYSSLDSSCYTLLSLKSCSSRMSTDSSLKSERPNGDDGMSITTNALDDFEFHGGEQDEVHQDTSTPNSRSPSPEFTNSDSDSFPSSKYYERNLNSASRKVQVQATFQTRTQAIPNFSSNNLVFLSPKRFREHNISALSSESNASGNILNILPNTDGSLQSSNLVSNCSREGIRLDSKVLPDFAAKPTVITVSNGSGFSCTHAPDQRLIIYSEYL